MALVLSNNERCHCTPSPAINIDTSVHMAFTADKLNVAKSYVDITDCWHVYYKHAKTFQSALSHYNGVVDRQRELYCLSAE
jgi:hypothetical protein